MTNCTCTCLKKTTFLLFPNLSPPPPKKKVEHQLGNFCEEVLFIKYSFFSFSFCVIQCFIDKVSKENAFIDILFKT